MKPFFKFILIVLGIICFLEFIPFILKQPFAKKYVDKLNADTKADIEYQSRFAPKTSKILPTDLNIIKGKDSLTFDETLTFLSRNPVAKFNYGTKYQIQICKIDTSFNSPMLNTLHESFIDSNLSINNGYAIDYWAGITFNYSNPTIKGSHDLYFNLYGNETKSLIKNDSVAYIIPI